VSQANQIRGHAGNQVCQRLRGCVEGEENPNRQPVEENKVTASGCDPTRRVQLKCSTIRELNELKKSVPKNGDDRPVSVHNVVQWLLDYYYESSGARRPKV